MVPGCPAVQVNLAGPVLLLGLGVRWYLVDLWLLLHPSCLGHQEILGFQQFPSGPMDLVFPHVPKDHVYPQGLLDRYVLSHQAYQLGPVDPQVPWHQEILILPLTPRYLVLLSLPADLDYPFDLSFQIDLVTLETLWSLESQGILFLLYFQGVQAHHLDRVFQEDHLVPLDQKSP